MASLSKEERKLVYKVLVVAQFESMFEVPEERWSILVEGWPGYGKMSDQELLDSLEGFVDVEDLQPDYEVDLAYIWVRLTLKS